MLEDSKTNNYRLRQKDLVPEQQISKHTAAVIGVGAVGRQVALQLACMGVGKLILIDPDIVEDVNIGTQLYRPEDIGHYKAAVTRIDCEKYKGICEHHLLKFEEVIWDKDEKMDIVFCCVDNMLSRGDIYRMVGDRQLGTDLLLDARVQGEVMRLFAVPLKNTDAKEYYRGAWFPDEEAFQGRCTDRMTLYSAYVSAGFLIAKYVTWMRRTAQIGARAKDSNEFVPLQVEIGINLATGTSTVFKELE